MLLKNGLSKLNQSHLSEKLNKLKFMIVSYRINGTSTTKISKEDPEDIIKTLVELKESGVVQIRTAEMSFSDQLIVLDLLVAHYKKKSS